MSNVNLTEEEVTAVQAIITAFYSERVASRFHAGSITTQTLELIAQLITESDECSRWIDSVPNPEDLLSPANGIRKWAIRIIRSAGEPFARGSVKLSLTCKLARGLQFRSPLEASLK